MKNNNNSITSQPASIIRRLISFLVAFFVAGLLINAMRGFIAMIFLLLVAVYPEGADFLVGSERLISNVGNVLNITMVVVAFLAARHVYRYLANTVPEENRKPISAIKTSLSTVIVLIGIIVYYTLPRL